MTLIGLMLVLKHHKWTNGQLLSNVINYVQSNRSPRHYYKLDVKALEPKNHWKI